MADLVIRGMEMPKDGRKHTALLQFLEDGKCRAIVEYSKSYDDRSVKVFEVIPLPEGHGDLIDRDAFRAENGLNAKCEHCPRNTYECQRDMIHTKMEFCEMLDDAAVIVPAEGGADDDDNA